MFRKSIKNLILAILLFLIFLILSYCAFLIFFNGKFFPGIYINNLALTGQEPENTLNNLNQEYLKRSKENLKIKYDNQNFEVNISSSSPKLSLSETLSQAYMFGRSGNIVQDFYNQVNALIFSQHFYPSLTFNKGSILISQISQINKTVKTDAQDAEINFGKEITVIPSSDGKELDDQLLLSEINSYLNLSGSKPEYLPFKIAKPKLTTQDAEKLKIVLEKVQNQPIKLYYNQDFWVIDQATLFSLLNFHETKPVLASFNLGSQDIVLEEISLNQGKPLTDAELLLDQDKLSDYIDKIAKKVDQPLKEAKFVFDQNSKRVTQFEPGQEGLALDKGKTASLIVQAVKKSTGENIELPINKTYPKTSAEDVNDFGIRELLGTGYSNFAGSIQNRIFNVGLAASRVNGVLVKPGDTFSFNQTIGDVSGATGYKPAYVIKSGRTVLDDGGGVCQVSTTLFRAVLNAGLPIIERAAHAYRVGYYEQGFPPGIDATVFYPTTDFKFKNDTPNHILIQAFTYGTSLTFQIYGTSDGRITTLSKPVILNQTPPPPDLRQDDPTLPKGEVKQVDWSAWGANVSFNRTVVRNGEEIIKETFRSNYKPWQAVFLVGTK